MNLIKKIKKIDKGTFLLLLVTSVISAGTILAALFILTNGTVRTNFALPSPFEKLTLDRSSVDKIKQTLGEPQYSENKKEGTYLYYPTINDDYKNYFTIKKNRAVFSIENIFTSDKGFLKDYIGKYGNYDFTIYDKEDEVVTWFIFLKAGVGLAIFGDGEIARILYFQPQSKEEFMTNVAKPLGFSNKRPSPLE